MKDSSDDVILVIEGTESSNDDKILKNTPAICKELNIKTMTLPDFLSHHHEINSAFE